MDPFEAVEVMARCRRCQKTWKTQLPKIMAKVHQESVCDTCDDLEAIERRRSSWEIQCPKRFQTFDPARFKGNRQLLAKAMEWRYGSEGLVLHGHTGQGKTWAAIKIAEREFMAGKSVAILNDSNISGLVAMSSESAVRYDESVRAFIRVDLLVLNDPFKGSLSERAQDALWRMVNERYEAARPIILTMNGTAKNIMPLLSPDRSKPLFERFNNTCKLIYFPKPEEKQ